ncbi:MAG: hypothetical protein NTU83_12590 [Candidatus Hydrogenedentes bacterium]|nr:hypothetical protein [Candidatus Hydrogenedentota bacterium]
MGRRTFVDTRQIEFAWRTESDLESELEAEARMPVRLVLTDNRSTIMSVRHDRQRGSAVVRIHRMFLAAEADIVQALARWIRSPRSKVAAEPLNRFIHANRGQIKARQHVQEQLDTHGEYVELKTIFDEVNRNEFDGAVRARITWGRMPSTRRRRSIRFGSYYPGENLIRIHPLLDQSFVPPYFVRYIVFHEMLHAALGVDDPPEGRRRVHTREFLAREKTYADYKRAVAWQANPDSLKRLLSKRSMASR